MHHNINNVRMMDFPVRGDEKEKLIVVEGSNCSFEIKRLFYIYGSDSDIVRGQHANKKSEVVLINVAGRSKVKVMDGE